MSQKRTLKIFFSPVVHLFYAKLLHLATLNVVVFAFSLIRANDKQEMSLFNAMDTNIIVSYDGKVKWLAPAVLRTECKIAIDYFPFDSQSCNIKIASWVHDVRHLNLRFKNENRYNEKAFLIMTRILIFAYTCAKLNFSVQTIITANNILFTLRFRIEHYA